MIAGNECVCNKCSSSKLSQTNTIRKNDRYSKENNVFQEENKLIYDIINNKLTVEDIIRAIIKSNNININEKKKLINYVENNIRNKIISNINANINNSSNIGQNNRYKIIDINTNKYDTNKYDTNKFNDYINNNVSNNYNKYSDKSYTDSDDGDNNGYKYKKIEDKKKNMDKSTNKKDIEQKIVEKKKKIYLVDFLKQNNLKVKRAKNDGNCLFNSLSLMIYGNERYSRYLREEAVFWIEENIEKEINGIKVKNMIFLKSNQKSYTDYLNDMLKDGEWGDYVCLLAICCNRMINVNLVIMGYNDIYVEDIDYIITNKNNKNSYWIQYNQCELHYNCLTLCN